MTNKIIYILFIFYVSCSNPNEKGYRGFYDSISCVDEKYSTGILKSKSYWYKGKRLGYMYEYDTLGNIYEITSFRMLYVDSLHTWNPDLDTVDIQKKESIVNCIWRFNSDGSLDSMKSNYFISEIKDTCFLGDSTILKLYLECPFFKNKNDTMLYEFYIKTTDNLDSVAIQYRNFNYTEYMYKPKKRGLQRIFFTIYEKNLKKDSVVDYQGCSRVFVR